MTTKPIHSRAVRIPCPGIDCTPRVLCDWIRVQCGYLVEYGYSDHYIYCDCGHSPDTAYGFQCNNPRHGSFLILYNEGQLFTLLKALDPFKELDILILGETGVGKSTFINTFMNYILFDELPEAIKAGPLNYIIPYSFTTQYIDISDPNDRLIQKDIKIGSIEDEHDGISRQSARQKTTVYPFRLDNIIVRLIDTPGIGDTCGAKQD